LSKEIMELFTQFNKVGVTLLIATHDLALVSSMNQRILTLTNGALSHDSKTEYRDVT
ncbi:MAG: cell division ATP-binding protein FtsE, partial [Candidatus Thiodiazotropha endolucinida]|nr:cell division ATP-binding protein FtsE [Candidatus Thiodiazotropha taylori]MCW4241164.1 cell division ATP-binding protein FtsE [Candidatus Thiodiazotropha taylori]